MKYKLTKFSDQPVSIQKKELQNLADYKAMPYSDDPKEIGKMFVRPLSKDSGAKKYLLKDETLKI